jgi:hypothetical protein
MQILNRSSIATALACAALAQADGSRLVEESIGVKNAPSLIAAPNFKPHDGSSDGGVAGGGCPQVISTYTNAAFDGGQYVVQAGFAQGESSVVRTR